MILKADQGSLRATANRSRERLSMAGNGHEDADFGAGNGTLWECSNLTKRQLLIWMGQKLNPEVPSYNMMMTFTIKGEIQPGRFLEAFQALIDHTDALRTVIEEVNG
ncbi:MAG: condensation domain-containing protein, partial [Ardenticatenaceae bacterium]